MDMALRSTANSLSSRRFEIITRMTIQHEPELARNIAKPPDAFLQADKAVLAPVIQPLFYSKIWRYMCYRYPSPLQLKHQEH